VLKVSDKGEVVVEVAKNIECWCVKMGSDGESGG
jgi:hypothetical protein